ncbi:uncharacterized protein LOC9634368 [Selaginella moellendorffii]|uniref:uncharacterized protein LOC9634368 n=1 Tax=Selaginella moellendorffii TaxID=88036 RepID=UPI000D1C8EE6|nr:uncharacterized protein LOC9634368 [Selaginella moellendorffii]|eukprot:XP_024526778.1 uncharacterized protein LOC9634368 [Selaginella moellendorffii]
MILPAWNSSLGFLSRRAMEGGGKVCKRCKTTFDPALNTSASCRFHSAMFVCRRHDDQKRYYELGPDDPPYDAKFYDCCGAEDPQAPGCKTLPHISYDDKDH